MQGSSASSPKRRFEARKRKNPSGLTPEIARELARELSRASAASSANEAWRSVCRATDMLNAAGLRWRHVIPIRQDSGAALEPPNIPPVGVMLSELQQHVVPPRYLGALHASVRAIASGTHAERHREIIFSVWCWAKAGMFTHRPAQPEGKPLRARA